MSRFLRFRSQELQPLSWQALPQMIPSYCPSNSRPVPAALIESRISIKISSSRRTPFFQTKNRCDPSFVKCNLVLSVSKENINDVLRDIIVLWTISEVSRNFYGKESIKSKEITNRMFHGPKWARSLYAYGLDGMADAYLRKIIKQRRHRHVTMHYHKAGIHEIPCLA